MMLKDPLGIERPQIREIAPVKRIEVMYPCRRIKGIKKQVKGICKRSVEIEN